MAVEELWFEKVAPSPLPQVQDSSVRLLLVNSLSCLLNTKAHDVFCNFNAHGLLCHSL